MFASASDRIALRTADFGVDFVGRFEKTGRRSELCADDIEPALDLQKSWIDKGANYVEIFRVLHDGTLNPTIGAHGALISFVGDEEQTERDRLSERN